MTKKTKKGFTIVELVVVIAVIAILSAVLIPTFVNLIHKAEFNNDKALVRNINTTLAISAAGEDGEATMYDTLVEVQKNGYVIENLTPRSSGSDIVWDAEHNQFVLVYKEGNATKTYTGTGFEPNMSKKENLWKIYSTVPAKENQDYSIYLKGEEYNTAVEVVGVGFDAGKNTTIPSVSYSNTGAAKDVTIRTNGYETDLLVDDETTGTIYHYGVAGSVEIVECHTSSFHEFGKVAFAEISKGRIVLEGGSEVNHIHVNAKEDDNGNKLDEFDTVVIAKAASVDMPDLSRDDVEIDAEGTLVVALQEGTNVNDDKDYVWLTKQGVFEQITISDKKDSPTSTTGVVWANDASVSETNQTAAQQIANNIGRGTNGAVSATVTVGTTEYKVTLDTTTRELVLTNTTTNQVETNSQVVTDAVAEAVETPKTAEEMKEEAIAAVVVNITASVETLGDGETFQLVATGSNLVWSSSDSDVATVSQTGLLTATGAGTVTITVTDGDQVKTCDVTVTYFHAGTGTNTDEYLIANAKQLTNIYNIYDENHAQLIYYKLINNIDLMEVTVSRNNYACVYSADINLNNYSVNNLDKGFVYFNDYLNIYNGTFNFIGGYPRVSSDGTSAGLTVNNEAHYSNLNLYGNATPNDSPFYGTLCMYIGNTSNTSQRTDVYVDGVNSWVSIRCSGTTVGGLFGYSRNTKMNITNTNVYSTIEATIESYGILSGYSSQCCGYVTTDGKGFGTIENVKFYGNIIVPSTSKCDYFAPNGTSYNSDVQTSSATLNKTIDITAKLSIPTNFGDEIKVIHSDLTYTKYIVTLSFNVDSTVYNAGGYPRTLSVTIDNLSGVEINSEVGTGLFKYYVADETFDSSTDTLQSSEVSIFTRNGDTVYYFDGEGYMKVSNGKVYVNVYAYASDGSIKAVGSSNYNGVQPE